MRLSAFRAGPATLTRHITSKVSFEVVEGAVVTAGEGGAPGFDGFEVGGGQGLVVERNVTGTDGDFGGGLPHIGFVELDGQWWLRSGQIEIRATSLDIVECILVNEDLSSLAQTDNRRIESSL